MTSNKVQTNYGTVVGKSQVTEEGKAYSAFLGIPYVKQPVGELRFKDPVLLEPWSGDFDATESKAECSQLNFFNLDADSNVKAIGTENCLVLNVFSPNLKGKLPVFVWIHGGGLAHGSNSTDLYGPDYFVEKDIVVVAINYRLGVMGFLSFKDPQVRVPGNAGLKDQSMALRWVKENIAHFGGDPNKITIGGESAGGASVHYQLLSPMSKGLFNRAIIESGSAFNPWASLPDDESHEYALAKALGWDGQGGDQGAFKVISSAEVSKILFAAHGLLKDVDQRLFEATTITMFLPKTEPYESRLCFLPKPAIELGKDPWSKDLDIIIGANKDEGMLWEPYFDQAAPAIERNIKVIVPYHLRITLSDAEQAAAASILKNIYFWKRDVEFKFKGKFVEILGDLTFWHGIHRVLLQRHFSGGSGKTYHYFYAATPDPEVLFCKAIRKVCQVPHENGTCHADELAMLWRSKFGGRPRKGNRIFPVFEQFFEAYSSFVVKGNPSNPKLGSKWETISEDPEAELFKAMKFADDSVECVPGPYEERMLVWDSIYKDETNSFGNALL